MDNKSFYLRGVSGGKINFSKLMKKMLYSEEVIL